MSREGYPPEVPRSAALVWWRTFGQPSLTLTLTLTLLDVDGDDDVDLDDPR
jgi:hypothetical protein